MEFTLSKWTATENLINYYPSIRQYPNKYLHLIPTENKNVTRHFIYVCPVCQKNYFLYINEIWSCSDEFTLDHYPPQNIGGQNTILTCKTCNNSAGSEYEPLLLEWLQMMNFNKKLPKSKIKAAATVSDKKGWYHSSLMDLT